MKKITIKIDDKEIEAEIKDRDYKELTEPKKKGLWVPEDGDNYFYVSTFIYVVEDKWMRTSRNYIRLYQCNVFRTKEEAKRKVEKLKALGRIRKYVHENDMYFEPDWGNSNQTKYVICYNYEDRELDWCVASDIKGSNVLPYLATFEHWERVVTDCEEDLKIVFGIN